MSFFQSLSETFSREAPKYKILFLPKHRVDIDYDDKLIVAGEAYCRIWLVEMRLAKDADRTNMVYKIQEHLRELGLQATKVQKRSLYSIMQRPLPPSDPATEAELAALEQLFQQNSQ
jgi:hypothetical protein